MAEESGVGPTGEELAAFFRCGYMLLNIAGKYQENMIYLGKEKELDLRKIKLPRTMKREVYFIARSRYPYRKYTTLFRKKQEGI